MDSAQLPKDNKIVPESDPHNLNLSSELEHVTQEMYKKNAELSLTNKTLSLLQKINSIILGSVTDIKQVAQHAVDLVVSEAGFQRVSIYVTEKENLVKLASSDGENVSRTEFLVKRKFPNQTISLANKENLFVKVNEMRKLMLSHDYYDVLTPDFTREEASIIQEAMNVKTILVYPLVVREVIIGVISIGLSDEPNQVTEFEQDLMNRLADIIGIAIDNSLLYQKIQEANERLKSLDQLKDEFVSLASHELRTPMTAIKSYVWLLLNGNIGELNEKQKTYLARTYTSTERLINMVNDMLNISRIESGRLTIVPAPIDMGKLVEETLQEVAVRAAEFKINLQYQKPTNVLTVHADPDRIKEVLINLIGNSIKFTPQNGTITISVTDNGQGSILTQVKDNGRGISQEDMQKLFQKFNMVGSANLTKARGQGTGLGLYLSKSLVELQGGKIWAESEGVGKGSTFSFTLPFLKSENVQTTVNLNSNSSQNSAPVANSGSELLTETTQPLQSNPRV